MSDRQFTLFELTIHEPTVQLGPRSLGGLGDLRSRLGGADDESDGDGSGDASEATDATAADAADSEVTESADDGDGSGDSGGSLLGKLVRLGLLAGVAVAAKKLMDDDEEGYGMDNVTDLGVVADRDSESGSDDDDAVPIEVTGGESDDQGRSRTAAVLGLVVLVAAAVAAKRLLGGGDELAELEELDEVAAEP